MDFKVESTSPVEVTITVTFSAAEVDAAIEEQYRDLTRKVTIRGFRKGKAPRKLIEAQFAKDVAAQTGRDLVEAHVPQVLVGVTRELMGEPEFELGHVVPGQPFVVTIVSEAAPELTVQGYKGIPLPRLTTEVAEERIDAEIERLRQSQASFTPADDGATVDTGHNVTVDFAGFLDGEPFPGGQATGHSLTIGEGRMIPGFEDQLIGLAVGETKEFDITFPADYHSERLAGKAARFKVTVTAIRNKTLPALDDAFAADVKADSLAALRERIARDFAAEDESRGREMLTRKAIDYLIAANPFSLPPKVAAAIQEKHVEQAMKRMPAAFADASAAQFRETMAEMLRAEAERQLRQVFLLKAIVRAESIEVTDDDITAHLAKLAETHKLPLPRVRAMFAGEEAQDRLKGDLIEGKVMNLILEWSVPAAPETEADAVPAPESADGEGVDVAVSPATPEA